MKCFLLRVTMMVAALIFGLAFPVFGNARAAAMGGAYTAVADDDSAPLWNPAGILQIKNFAFSGTIASTGNKSIINKLLEGNITSTDYFSFIAEETHIITFTTPNVALSYISNYNGFGKREPTYWIGSASGVNCGVITTAGFLGALAVGVNFKQVDLHCTYMEWNGASQSYLSMQGDGMVGDIGFLYQMRGDLGLKIGLVAKDVFGNVHWTNVKRTVDGAAVTPPITPDPKSHTYVLGLAYSGDNLLIAGDMEVYRDFNNPEQNQNTLHLGLEHITLDNPVVLRIGGITTFEASPVFTAGLGFKFGPVQVDGAMLRVMKTLEYQISAELKF